MSGLAGRQDDRVAQVDVPAAADDVRDEVGDVLGGEGGDRGEHPAELLALVMPALLAAELGLHAVALRQGWLREKLRADLDVLRWLPRLLRERRTIQRRRTISAAEFADHLTATLGRTPSKAEVAERAGIDVRAVDDLADDVHRAVVLNYDSLMDSGDGEGVLPADHMTPEATLIER